MSCGCLCAPRNLHRPPHVACCFHQQHHGRCTQDEVSWLLKLLDFMENWPPHKSGYDGYIIDIFKEWFFTFLIIQVPKLKIVDPSSIPIRFRFRLFNLSTLYNLHVYIFRPCLSTSSPAGVLRCLHCSGPWSPILSCSHREAPLRLAKCLQQIVVLWVKLSEIYVCMSTSNRYVCMYI